MSSIRDANRIQALEDKVEHLTKKVDEVDLKCEVLNEIWEQFRDAADLDPKDDKPIKIPDMPEDLKILGYKEKPDPQEKTDGG
jgi:hypothetical protein